MFKTRSMFLAGLCLAGALTTVHADNSQPNFGSSFDDRYWFGAAAGTSFTDSTEFDNGPAALLTFGKTLYPRWMGQVEVHYEELDVNNVGGSTSDAEFVRYGLGVSVQHLTNFGRLQVGPLVGAHLRNVEFLGAREGGLGLHAGLGSSLKVGKRLDFTLEARYLVDPVNGRGGLNEGNYYSWNALVGVRVKLSDWPAAPPDADKDRVGDYKDRCPNTPRGVAVDASGCPLDEDEDGVSDHRDRCPGTADGIPVDDHGCPLDSDKDGVPNVADQCPDTLQGVPVGAQGCPLDTDQDGVIDSKDLCPNTPLGAQVDINGCPADTDQDGVSDFLDRCPNTPYGTPVNERGCSLDSDADGVPNTDDACPNTFLGLEVDAQGCPVKNQVLVLHDVHFEFDRATLFPDSRELLGKVAKSLLDQPGVRIEVHGHTDSLGSDAYNRTLSQARADAVRAFLAGQRVPAALITATGHGESRPVASNETDEGRARNRRVELRLVD